MAGQRHWLAEAASEARIAAGALAIPPSTPTGQAWDEVTSASHLPAMEVCRAVARKLGLPVAGLTDIDPQAVECVPERLRQRLEVIPLRRDGVKLFVATSDPYNFEAAKQIEFATGLCVVFALAPPRAIRRLLQKDPPAETTDVGFKVLPSPPRLAGLCIREAIRRQAPRIELNADVAGGNVLIAGRPKEALLRLPVPLWRSVLQTLKTIAGLDAGDTSGLQVGHVRYEVDGRPWDLTVTSGQAGSGEAATIMISEVLAQSTLQSMGFDTRVICRMRDLLAGTGIVVVCGAKGAEKAATLRGLTDELLRSGKDVVELEGGGRVARSSHDVGRVAIVGRADDPEAAGAAIASALSGHLVVISVKAEDPASALEVLDGHGIDGATRANIIRGLVFVQSVRRLCPACAAPIGRMTDVESRLARQYEITPLFRAVGCAQCRLTGFSGTIPLAHVTDMDGAAATGELRLGCDLIATGQTTIEEAARLWAAKAIQRPRLMLVKES